MKLKELKRGDYFCKKEIEFPRESQVWVKGEYDRSTKKYVITRFSDISDSQLMSGDKEVYVDMTF